MKKLKVNIIITLLILFQFSNAQTWERTFGSPDNWEKIYSAGESYDKGFILSSRLDALKTIINKIDINGYVLWDILVTNENKISIEGMDLSPDGSVFITGVNCNIDIAGDPFILKVNSCGKFVWCKNACFEKGNYGRRVIELGNKSLIWLIYLGDPILGKDNQLFKLDSLGDLIWRQEIVPTSEYPLIKNPIIEDVILTSDNGFLLTGFCYYPEDTINPSGTYKLRSLLVKTDSLGIEQWVLPVGSNENIISTSNATIELNNAYYSVGYRWDTSYIFTSPFFYKVDKSGKIIYHKILHSGDTLENYLIGLENINDTSLVIVGRIRRNEEDSLRMGIFKTDTLGNIITWMENNNGSPINQCLVKTNDNKFLITGYTVHSGNYDGYAVKVNENIEFDSLYTYPFNYDTLCPDPIVSDTIECDCDILVNQEEIKKPKENSVINVYPNPTKSIFNISIPVLNENEITNSSYTIEIFDIYGRKVKEIKVPKGQNKIEIDVGGWRKGLYLVRVRSGLSVFGSEKVVVN